MPQQLQGQNYRLRGLHGVIAYLITPFDQKGKIDTARLCELVDRLVADGVHGIAPLGSAGLNAYLTPDEREQVIESVCSRASGRLPVIVGASGSSVEEAVRTARFAEKCGASALLAAPTSDWRLTSQEIFNFYDKLADRTTLPIMVYDTSMKSGGLMTADELLELTKIPSVTMLKDSSADVERLQDLLLRNDGRLEIFAGKNTFAVPALMLGCRGWCTAAPLVAPKATLALYEAAVTKRDLQRSLDIGRALQPLLQALVRPGLPRSLLAALELVGRPAGELRAPMLRVSAKDRATIAAALDSLCQLHLD